MRSTTTLLIRNLLSKLHPPSPVSASESQKLLQLLDTSFRHRFDQVHPPVRTAVAPSNAESIPIDPPNATNLHLNSILHHPLLGPDNAAGHVTGGNAAIAVSRFETAVKTGNLTDRALRTYCKQYVKARRSGEVIPPQGKLGEKIDAWLSSTSEFQTAAFLTLWRDTLPLVVSMMYVDGLEQEVWNWLSLLYTRKWDIGNAPPFLEVQSYLHAEDNLVSLMVQASCAKGSFQYAAAQYIQAAEYRASTTLAKVNPTEDELRSSHTPLQKSWARVSYAILARQTLHGISATTYDQLLKHSVRYASVTRGLLMLYHPESPQFDFLLKELRANNERTLKQLALYQTGPASMQRNISRAILDAAELAIKHSKPSEAQFFMDLTRKLWPSTFKPTDEVQPTEQLAQARQDQETHRPWNPALQPTFAVT